MTTEIINGRRPAHRAERTGRTPSVPAAQQAVQQDATTRYLCAAAHLDPAFRDAAIAEFLVEPVRALPPAPGIDSTAVLRDAVAARARRRLRDVVLLLLLVVLAFVSLPGLVVWFIGALAASAVLGLATARGQRNSVIFTLFVVAGIVLLLQRLSGGLLDGLGISYGLIIVVLLALAVIGIDEFIVHQLVYTRFRPRRFVPDGRHASSRWERAVRTLGHGSFRAPLARVAAAGEHATAQHPNLADVVVHRGFSPFIGAGERVRRQIITLPLEPATKDGEGRHGEHTRRQPRGISVAELQQHVAAAISELRSSSSLGPGGRLAGLTQREQVLMAADRLGANLDPQPQPAVLPDLRQPPAAHMPTAAARHLADTPQEWARYYQCFRIEAWDRDLTTSCYLHAGTDQRMLFLERTLCVLPPIRHSYRLIDRWENPFLAPLRRSLTELMILPATVIRRYRSVLRRFEPLAQREGEIVPDRYGAGKSLRELAADNDVQNYFQDVDVERYVKILDSALVRAVGQYLEDRGYSVVEFMKLADPVVNQTQHISGGTFLGSAVGFGNTAQGTVTPSAPPRTSP